jgi:AcrR family transcriptional regulator
VGPDDQPFGGRFGVAIGARYEGILGAARDVIARRGFQQASIREIASASGLSLAGLYHYVGGKDELLFMVLDRALDPHALKIVNRDYELLAEPHRSEVAAKRQEYLRRGLAVLRELDRRQRSEEELLSATNLLLGMLNGIGTRPFVRSGRSVRTLASEVASLFLHGFLDGGVGASSHDPEPATMAAELDGAGQAGRAGSSHPEPRG